MGNVMLNVTEFCIKGQLERWLNQREDTPVKMPVGLRCDMVNAQECHMGQACNTEAEALVPMCLERILAVIGQGGNGVEQGKS